MIEYGHTTQDFVDYLSRMSAWETIRWFPSFVASRWQQQKKETVWYRIAASIEFAGLWLKLVITNHRRNH